MLAAATVAEELAYFTPRRGVRALRRPGVVGGPHLDGAPPHIRGEFLPRLIRGEIVGSFATSEPEASTDLPQPPCAPGPPPWRVVTGCPGTSADHHPCAADIMTVLCVVDDGQAMPWSTCTPTGFGWPNRI